MDTRKDHYSPMLFELTMRMFVGEAAYNIAGQVFNEKDRKEMVSKSPEENHQDYPRNRDINQTQRDDGPL
jgi:hypothetical protein